MFSFLIFLVFRILRRKQWKKNNHVSCFHFLFSLFLHKILKTRNTWNENRNQTGSFYVVYFCFILWESYKAFLSRIWPLTEAWYIKKRDTCEDQPQRLMQLMLVLESLSFKDSLPLDHWFLPLQFTRFLLWVWEGCLMVNVSFLRPYPCLYHLYTLRKGWDRNRGFRVAIKDCQLPLWCHVTHAYVPQEILDEMTFWRMSMGHLMSWAPFVH